MKLTIELKTGKAGTRTMTSVEGEPANQLERLIYDCLHAAVNVGLDNAREILAAKDAAAKAPKLAAKIVSIHSGPLPDANPKP